MLGLALAFYVQPVRVWAIRSPEGDWTVRGACRKGGAPGERGGEGGQAEG